MDDYLRFYISFGSPFSYIVSQRIDELASKYNKKVLWRPVRLRNVLNIVYSNTGGFNIPQKKLDYLRLDSNRMAKFYGLPFIPPNDQPPFDCDEVYFCVYSLANGNEEVLRNICMAISSSIWQKGMVLKSVNDIVYCLSQFYTSKNIIINNINNNSGKELHRRSINDAVNSGMIGSPWITYKKEIFWGNDRLDYLDYFLSNLN
ncbi:MAG: hypothetical protein CMM18_03865 [Rhodospirillaceae bacterium]|nr:hypothetical protein [Rhodospirillaceae bacterium]|tara:strand:- start:1199 stop:1807 length:609 start_codon:yes stop_codon:yes gene_type:complete